MASYTILSAAKPGQSDADAADAIVIDDRFSWLAFLLGGLWFLWHRVWFVGVLVVLADLAIAYAAFAAGHWVLGYAFDLALALLVGLEGQNWRLEAALSKGFRVVDIVEADNSETAFEKYALRLSLAENASSLRKTPPRLPSGMGHTAQPPLTSSGMIGLVPSGRGN